MLSLLIAVIVAALIFDYINDFHDAANAIATSVSTGVLHIRTAVILAAIFNFGGAMMGTAVAKTIASGFASETVVDQTVVLAALIGASAWNLFTWWKGIPSSSSHALVGGLAGAVTAHAGTGAFNWSALGEKVLLPLVTSPIMGFIIAFFVMVGLMWLFRRARPSTVNHASRGMQLTSACAMAFAHGSNDAQKVMGVISLSLASFMSAHPGQLPEWMAPTSPKAIPMWVMVACASAMALGTAAGGKRIIKTMGSKMIRISPLHGFAAETAGTATILTASAFGVPVSTTHCISAAIMGSGASTRLSAVRWGVAGNLIVAWVLTLPMSALVAYLAMHTISAIF